MSTISRVVTPRTHTGRETAAWPTPCSWRRGSLVKIFLTMTQWDLARPSQNFTFATTNAHENSIMCTFTELLKKFSVV